MDVKKLDKYIAENWNVLFIGKHGVGKTSVVLDAFNRAGLNWRYYSAATMDPWVDLIGVPKEVSDGNGSTYLDLIRPKEFQDDQVEALFFDEFNRAPKKVRNAVMELIQFKSINGKRYRRLRIVWAAINPSDDDANQYDVEKLDPAQEDRFQIKIFVPYTPSLSYFRSRYGGQRAEAAIAWWKALPNPQKDLVSPRRLDYALQVFESDGDVRDVLPTSSNPAKLITHLHSGVPAKILAKLREKDKKSEIQAFLANENNYSASLPFITKPQNFDYFIPLLPKEKIAALFGDSKSRNDVRKFKNIVDDPKVRDVISDILESKGNFRLVKWIQQSLVLVSNEAVLGSGSAQTTFIKGTKGAGVKYYETITARMRMASNTYHRKQALYTLKPHLAEFLTIEECHEILKALDIFAKNSHVNTLKHEGFVSIVNHCLHRIYQTENKVWKDIESWFKKRHPSIMRRILLSPVLAKSMLCP